MKINKGDYLILTENITHSKGTPHETRLKKGDAFKVINLDEDQSIGYLRLLTGYGDYIRDYQFFKMMKYKVCKKPNISYDILLVAKLANNTVESELTFKFSDGDDFLYYYFTKLSQVINNNHNSYVDIVYKENDVPVGYKELLSDIGGKCYHEVLEIWITIYKLQN